MSKQDSIAYAAAGLLAWAAATAYYVAFGPRLFEMAFWFYVLNAFLAAGATTLLYQGVIRLRRTPMKRRPLAAAIFSIPGVLCGALLLVKLTELFPEVEPVTIGRYGAFLFVGYATVAVTAFEKKLKPAASHAR